MSNIMEWFFQNVAGPCPGGFQFSWGFLVATAIFVGWSLLKSKLANKKATR